MAKREHMHDKTDTELTTLLADTRKALREARFASAGARPADASGAKKLRARVARVLTEERARLITT
jgi:ribosomal protein L29